jgi:hypothetical protein
MGNLLILLVGVDKGRIHGELSQVSTATFSEALDNLPVHHIQYRRP